MLVQDIDAELLSESFERKSTSSYGSAEFGKESVGPSFDGEKVIEARGTVVGDGIEVKADDFLAWS